MCIYIYIYTYIYIYITQAHKTTTNTNIGQEPTLEGITMPRGRVLVEMLEATQRNKCI